ncbi:hypothetical protein ABVF47_009560 [Snodgrassella alvi]|uniref:hypothetical protein n=1 Tax=Snodgrassella alvi TaxID=1196083 RepID=UPI00352C03CE
MERKLDDSEIGVWKLYSYYALSAEEQIFWIGKAEEWFVEEDDLERYSRNFLIGVALSLNEYFRFFDYGTDETESIAKELCDFIESKLSDCYGDFFSISKIPYSMDWDWIREIANMILTLTGYGRANFRKPLDINEYIEAYDYVFQPRRNKGKQEKRSKKEIISYRK